MLNTNKDIILQFLVVFCIKKKSKNLAKCYFNPKTCDGISVNGEKICNRAKCSYEKYQFESKGEKRRPQVYTKTFIYMFKASIILK